MPETIPIIDLQKFGLHVADSDSVDDSVVEKIAEELYTAFSTIGFCYIVNHGIPQTLIDDALFSSKIFFFKPPKEKQRYAREDDNIYSGWHSLGSENLGAGTYLQDYKESYNFFPFLQTCPPDIQNVLGDMFDKCTQLTHRLFNILSVALKLQDVEFLSRCHEQIGCRGNRTCLRSLYYPQIPSEKRLEPGLIRCGEHSDYGTITLLFQDNAGGLEVQNTSGEYIAATPVPGSVVVNLGDLMQRWTADRLKATRHRVVIPEAEVKKKQSRQSLAFFVNPDNDTVIRSLEGSNKFTPFRFEDYILAKLEATVPTEG